MSEFTKHEPGTFTWTELGTTDSAAAKAFYTELFGWSFNDHPMGPGEVYTMFTLRGKPVAAGFQMSARMAGVPPHWGAYITVANVDEAAKKAEKLGAKLVSPPFDVMEEGRMAVLQDPTGATVSLWQAKKHIGANILNEPGALTWNELGTKNVPAATKFYTELFGWTADVMDMGTMKYTTFKLGEKMVGGMMEMGAEYGDMPPFWMVYIETANCDATAERAAKLGAKTMVPPTDIPGVGRFAILGDKQGAGFGILQYSKS